MPIRLLFLYLISDLPCTPACLQKIKWINTIIVVAFIQTSHVMHGNVLPSRRSEFESSEKDGCMNFDIKLRPCEVRLSPWYSVAV